MNKNVDNSNVPVCTWDVVRTLVLLLEWLERCSSLVCPLLGGSSAYIIASKFDSICSILSCLLQYWDIN